MRLRSVKRAEYTRRYADYDKRVGVSITIRDGVKLPDIDWVKIPAGEFTYQDGKMTLDYDFYMARYPVTYAQFQTFIDDPEGYKNRKRWFKGLAACDDDKQIRDQRFKYANHPRETVNWYQAIAFCRWFSWRLGGGYALDAVDQWAVRLPTEFEWEKAARANTGWKYPYGDNFDAAKGNTSGIGINQTSAVGIFPHGDTPHWSKPISDLSGNVWEWCLTDYENPQTDVTKENLSSSARRVLRGGSFHHLLSPARASYRNFDSPYNDHHDSGVRLVVAPKQPKVAGGKAPCESRRQASRFCSRASLRGRRIDGIIISRQPSAEAKKGGRVHVHRAHRRIHQQYQHRPAGVSPGG